MSNQSESAPHDQMMQMITALWVSKSIGVMARLGVADHMADGPTPVSDLAEAVAVNPDALFRTMRALAAVGIFDRTNGDQFSLTDTGSLLRSDAPQSLRWMAAATTEDSHWQPWGKALDVLKTGESQAESALGCDVWSYYEQNNQELKAFVQAMGDFSAAEMGPIGEAYDFKGLSRIVDVGGSHGGMLDVALAGAPEAQGVLFDSPSVVDSVDLSKLKHGDRIEKASGDFFDAVPKGGDAYIMKHIIHDWNDERTFTIFRNIRDAIADDGRLLVMEMVLSDESPPFVPWLDVHMLVMCNGKERTEPEYAALLNGAGFKLNRVVPTKSPISIIEGLPS